MSFLESRSGRIRQGTGIKRQTTGCRIQLKVARRCLLRCEKDTPAREELGSAMTPANHGEAREDAKLVIMVSATVLDKKELLDQVFAILEGYGYEVWMSSKGTLPVHPGKSNLTTCLRAAETCDAFLGIISGRYGDAPPGKWSITHQEIRRAIQRKKRRWFLVHHDVAIAWQLLRPFGVHNGTAPPGYRFEPSPILDDIRVLRLYEDALQMDVAADKRRGNWVQEYSTSEDALRFVQAQFDDAARIRSIVVPRSGTQPLSTRMVP